MIRGWDIVNFLVMKPFSKWRPSAILNFRKLLFSSCGVCQSMVLLVYTKYHVNQTITHWDIAKIRFSILRLSAILNFIIFINQHTLSSNQNLSLHTKFQRNQMIPGRPFSKWWLSAILNFQNLVFWSRDLCLNVILLIHAKFRVNRTINLGDIAKRRFSIWRPSPMLDLLWRHHILHLRTLFLRS